MKATEAYIVLDQIDIGKRVDAFLKRELPRVGKELINSRPSSMSLRELARRCKLSPTYICEVGKGHKTISVDAFLTVNEVLKGEQ